VTAQERREARLARYAQLRAERPHLFANPPGAAYEIVLDRDEQERVAERSAAHMRERGLPEEYGDIGVIYEDDYVILVRDAVRYRTGDTGTYIRILDANTDPGAVVLPRLSDGRLLLVRHFRHGTRQWHWEIPRGWGEPGADGLATARTELAEEVGLPVKDVVPLGRVQHDDQLIDICLAEIDLVSGDLPPPSDDAHVEGIDQRTLLSLDEFERMVNDGEITDMCTLVAYALATAKGLLRPA